MRTYRVTIERMIVQKATIEVEALGEAQASLAAEHNTWLYNPEWVVARERPVEVVSIEQTSEDEADA